MGLELNVGILLAPSIPGLTSLQNVAGWTLMGWVRLKGLTTANVLWDASGGTGTNTRASIVIETTGAMTVQARSADGETLRLDNW